ncbi:MAG: glycosyltransferase [Mucilaginibacter sp.]
MNKKPLVSVLIPCYNHEDYIIECLTSVLKNDYENKEIVVIDDGSRDNSATIIKKWVHDNKASISVDFLKRENRGLTKTLNELIQRSKGEYICILASDDLLTHNSISVRVQALVNHPNKLAVIGDAHVIDSEGTQILDSAIEDLYYGNKNKYTTDEALKNCVIKEWSIPGPVMMAKRSLYDIIGIYPEDLVAEDLNFYLQVIGRGLLLFIDEFVAFYRVHDLNSCRIPKNQKQIMLTIIKSHWNNIKYYEFKFKAMISLLLVKNIAFYIKRLLTE